MPARPRPSRARSAPTSSRRRLALPRAGRRARGGHRPGADSRGGSSPGRAASLVEEGYDDTAEGGDRAHDHRQGRCVAGETAKDGAPQGSSPAPAAADGGPLRRRPAHRPHRPGTGPRRRPSLGVQPTRTACTSSTTMEHGRAISRSDQLVLREVLDLEPLRQRIAAPPVGVGDGQPPPGDDDEEGDDGGSPGRSCRQVVVVARRVVLIQ